jgi:transposase-like protein
MAKIRKTYTEEFKVETVKLILDKQQALTETANNLGRWDKYVNSLEIKLFASGSRV